MADQLKAMLRAKQVAEYLSIGISTHWRNVKVLKDKGYPQPHKLGPRTTVFLKSDVDAWITRCVEG